MPDTSRKRIRLATIVYWVLLLYIIAALVWWFISLQRQNIAMSQFRENQLRSTINQQSFPVLFASKMNQINSERGRNLAKYIGEGTTFLILILVGAAFVYRSVRRQFRLQQQQQNFMMAVTHELKTPISVARLNLETLQRHHLDEEKRKKIIQMTLQETLRLNTLTNNILVVSQMEGGGYRRTHEDLNFSRLLEDRVHDFNSRFPERHISADIEPDIDIEGDTLLLQMMINNLIENAIKYSSRESPVTCRLHHAGTNTILEVIDEGPGVPENEKQKIFGKFYRMGDEATRRTQGTGLGLYLCSRIARDHNADITVTNHLPQGSNFTVLFHA